MKTIKTLLLACSFFAFSFSSFGQINTNGTNVGIGTPAPPPSSNVRVDINGNVDVGNIANPRINVIGTGEEKSHTLQLAVASCNGCYSGIAKIGDGVIRTLGGGDLILSIPSIFEDRKIAFMAGEQTMTIQQFTNSEIAKVGIGTTNFPFNLGSADLSKYRLYVSGGILTEEMRVRTGWADYVFDDKYTLKPLIELESYIEEYGHLPNVPSAEQVEKEGIEIGNITRIQQEKIEELTLYTIQQQKEINDLKNLVNQLLKQE